MTDQHYAWTEERIEQLKALAAEGLSAKQIALKLGGVTRNAVVGKLRRVGVELENASGPRARQRRAKWEAATKSLAAARLLAIRGKLDPGLPPPTPDEEPVLRHHVAFMDLERHHCRWPVGNQFCGADAIDTKPYCAVHFNMATRK